MLTVSGPRGKVELLLTDADARFIGQSLLRVAVDSSPPDSGLWGKRGNHLRKPHGAKSLKLSNEAPPQTDEPCYNRRRP